MTHAPSRVVRNSALMIGAMTLQKLIALVYFSLIARLFGKEVTGEFVFASSIGMMLTVLFDFGQTPLLIRSGAQGQEQSKSDFGALLATKFLLAAVVGGTMIALILSLPLGSDLLRTFLVLITLSSIFETLQMSFYGLLRCQQWIALEASFGVLGQLVILGFVLAVHSGVLPLPMLVGGILAMNVAHVLVAGVAVFWRTSVSFHPTFSFRVLAGWLYRASPFAIAQVFVKAGTYTDTMLLRLLSGASALGIYSVPYKFMFSFQFIPLGLVSALFPAMSYYVRRDEAKLEQSFHRAMELLLFFASPIAFGIAATAKAFIPLLFGGAYEDAIGLTELASFALLPIFLQYPIGSLLNASDRATVQTRLLGYAMVINIVINALLIPVFGAWGAVVAVIVTHSFIVLAGFVKIRTIIPIAWRRFMRTGGIVLGSSLVMFAAVRVIGVMFPNTLALQVFVGGTVYALLTWRFGVWRFADLRRLFYAETTAAYHT